MRMFVPQRFGFLEMNLFGGGAQVLRCYDRDFGFGNSFRCRFYQMGDSAG